MAVCPTVWRQCRPSIPIFPSKAKISANIKKITQSTLKRKKLAALEILSAIHRLSVKSLFENHKKEGRLTPAPYSYWLIRYFCFSSIASRVWVAEVTIGVPGPKILAAPAARSSS